MQSDILQDHIAIYVICHDTIPHYTVCGNINNFNVIYLLTNGAPACDTYYRGTAGKTDLLVTWLYKLTIDNKDYNLGAVIGILTFVLMATLSLITYRRTGSYKNEEGFS